MTGRTLHAMMMAERSGVEIDYCPRCRGIWLDRGELDKIIERSETAAPAKSHGQAVTDRACGHAAANYLTESSL
jgi:Zn-finger nucleic acid-binding protein